MIDESLLHRVKIAIRGQTFDGGDGPALRRNRKRQARQLAPAVEQNRASATLAVIAAFLGTGQAQTLTQQIEEGRTNIERKLMVAAVYVQSNVDGFVPVCSRWSCRCLGAGMANQKWGRGRGGCCLEK